MSNSQKQVNAHPEGTDFKEYLLSEYSNIAQAHFKTIDTISTFFRNYLVIVSIPISLVAILVGIFAGSEVFKTIVLFRIPISFLLLAVSLAGVGVLFYIVNLRMDAILYARTINGIRKYFYDRAELDINIKLRTRVLPQSPHQPAYHEEAYFWPVVFSFAIFNTLYLAFATVGFSSGSEFSQLGKVLISVPLWAWLLNPAFFIFHFVGYWGYSWYRERIYLRSYIIGVDIDGVLTQHRKQFCDLLRKNTHKEVDPEKITTIPVHECENLDVSRDDEKEVFNDPDYWIDMPTVPDAADTLERIRNIFKFKVFMFTYRPWPNVEKMNEEEKKRITNKWEDSLHSFRDKAKQATASPGVAIEAWSLWRKPIDKITELWLRKHGLKYDKLIIEKGNEDVPDPRGHIRNRFFKSREYKIKYFVEDDWEKAVKLAYICDVVFLLDQPYNRPDEKYRRDSRDLPNNVLPVETWDEIYRHIRMLS